VFLVGAQGQGPREKRQFCGQRRIKMREQGVAARGFENQLLTQSFGFKRHEHEIGLAGKMPGGGFLDLLAGREMDEAIGQIDWRAIKATGCGRRSPESLRRYFIDQRQCSKPPAKAIKFWWPI